jgi:hypothetical protein
MEGRRHPVIIASVSKAKGINGPWRVTLRSRIGSPKGLKVTDNRKKENPKPRTHGNRPRFVHGL